MWLDPSQRDGCYAELDQTGHNFHHSGAVSKTSKLGHMHECHLRSAVDEDTSLNKSIGGVGGENFGSHVATNNQVAKTKGRTPSRLPPRGRASPSLTMRFDGENSSRLFASRYCTMLHLTLHLQIQMNIVVHLCCKRSRNPFLSWLPLPAAPQSSSQSTAAPSAHFAMTNQSFRPRNFGSKLGASISSPTPRQQQATVDRESLQTPLLRRLAYGGKSHNVCGMIWNPSVLQSQRKGIAGFDV